MAAAKRYGNSSNSGGCVTPTKMLCNNSSDILFQQNSGNEVQQQHSSVSRQLSSSIPLINNSNITPQTGGVISSPVNGGILRRSPLISQLVKNSKIIRNYPFLFRLHQQLRQHHFHPVLSMLLAKLKITDY